MSEPAKKLLEANLVLANELDKAQKQAREALKCACDSGQPQVLLDIAIAISTIDKAWHKNNEQTQEIGDIINSQSGILTRAAAIRDGVKNDGEF